MTAAADLDHIIRLTRQLTIWLPIAIHHTDPGDGLRSPNLQPGRSNSHEGPTPHTALDTIDRTRWVTDVHTTIRTARWTLTTSGIRLPATLPADHLQAITTVTTHLAATPDDLDSIGGHLTETRHQLAIALSITHRHLGPATKAEPDPPTPGCANCAKHGIHTERAADGGRNCRWCADIHRASAAYPDAELLAHHGNGRVPSRAYQEFEQRCRERRHKARARAKRKSGRR